MFQCKFEHACSSTELVKMRYIPLILSGVIVSTTFASNALAQNSADAAGAGSIRRVDTRLDTLIPADANIEKVTEGFTFIEGPVWVRDEAPSSTTTRAVA